MWTILFFILLFVVFGKLLVFAIRATWSIAKICFIIGGSFGLSKEVKNMAQVKLSMSAMTFPHHLARVMLLEQIYRGYKILGGGKYHK